MVTGTSKDYGDSDVPSKKIVISENDFSDCDVNWPIGIGPQDHCRDERVQDVIVEKNLFATQPNVRNFIETSAKDLTLRNNLFVDLNTCDDCNAILVMRRGREPDPKGVELYHNTMYSNIFPSTPSQGNERQFLYITAYTPGENLLAMNNIFYIPNNPGAADFIDPSSNAALVNQVITSNNFGEVNPAQDPQFVSSNPVNPSDFHLQSTSPAKNAGAVVPVLADFAGNVRPKPGTGYDIGAFEDF